jgi:hypothetical protein
VEDRHEKFRYEDPHFSIAEFVDSIFVGQNSHEQATRKKEESMRQWLPMAQWCNPNRRWYWTK